MRVAGIIAEYNPLHIGHLRLLEQTRARLGAETAVVCVMSGNFVQRGEPALMRKHVRAAAAVRSGADLVLELELPWAVSSAERFADGAIQTLAATGLVTHLAFGSESGDLDALERTAAALCSEAFSPLLQAALETGVSFAAARQQAVEQLVGAETAACLRSPNNLLGVEYCKSLHLRRCGIHPLTVPREGAGHDEAYCAETGASASAIRTLLREGKRELALSHMADAMREAYLAEEAEGRAPVFPETCERSVLARLRTMTLSEFARLDEGEEGLYRRLYDASRTAASVEEVLSAAKTKRYAYARLRRMVLWACLGISPREFPLSPPYLYPLAANAVGRTLLAQMRKSAAIPVLTKPADVRRLSPEAKELFAWEARATDLYTLAYPSLSAARGASAWREGPVIL